MRQFLEAHPEDVFGLRKEALVARNVVGCEPGDLALHGFRVARVVKVRTVVEADTVERCDGYDIDVVFEPSAGKCPQLFEQEWCRDDGRPGVEREAVLPKDAGASTRLLQSVDHRHAKAACTKTHGRGQPAEARADDDGVRRCVRDGNGCEVRIESGVVAASEPVDPFHEQRACDCGGARDGEGAAHRRSGRALRTQPLKTGSVVVSLLERPYASKNSIRASVDKSLQRPTSAPARCYSIRSMLRTLPPASVTAASMSSVSSAAGS